MNDIPLNESSESPPQRIALIGASGSGKTCFIGALYWLGKESVKSRFSRIGASGDSLKYLRVIESMLDQHKLPPSTHNLSALEFKEAFTDTHGDNRLFSFIVYDYKGESLKGLDSQTNPLFKVWAESEYLLVFVDPQADVAKMDNLWDAFSQLDAGNKKLAVLITKSDLISHVSQTDNSRAAMDFFKKRHPKAEERIVNLGFKKWSCFFIAPLGIEPTASKTLPHDIQPFGYEMLFDWISKIEVKKQTIRKLQDLWRKIRDFYQREKPWLIGLVLMFLVFVAWHAIIYKEQREARMTGESPMATLEQKVDATFWMAEEDARKFFDEQFEHLDKEVADNNDDFHALHCLVKEKIETLKQGALTEREATRIKEIEIEARRKLGNLIVVKVKNSPDADTRKKLIRQWLGDELLLPEHMSSLVEISSELAKNDRDFAKQEIQKITVGSDGRDTEKMNQKMQLIRDYNFWNNDTEKKEAIAACDDMKRLIERGEFTITEIYAKGLQKGRVTFVVVASGEWSEEEVRNEREKHLNTKEKHEELVEHNWRNEEISDKRLKWKPGDKIRIEWVRKALWRGRVIAFLEYDGGWTTLLEMLNRHDMQNFDEYSNFENSGPKINIKCEEFPNPEESLVRITKFIVPGSYWEGLH